MNFYIIFLEKIPYMKNESRVKTQWAHPPSSALDLWCEKKNYILKHIIKTHDFRKRKRTQYCEQ